MHTMARPGRQVASVTKKPWWRAGRVEEKWRALT